MGATLTKFHQKRAKQRQMAINEVDMRLNTYPWPDGKPRLDSSGAPRVIRSELLRSVGLSDQYHQKGKALFEDEWYKEQVALELARRNESFKLEAAKFHNEALECAANMLHELCLRVKEAPGSLSSEFLAKYSPSMLKLGLELEARINAESEGHKKPTNATQLFAQNLVYLEADRGKEIVQQLTEHNEQRKDEIVSLVRARNALEREVVDGTALEEGTAE